eukprot:TRINITY_DN638_c0_g1_i2.p1 TRINITY_DN638_c0_g1~~TRINITY_DN638_c0_g1_i2.p1  ORF type:complete len:239 (-),score=55.62 TRINITY_DN638_c0_g1_i2:668-1384(-)
MKKSIILLALLALAISPLAFADDNKTEGKKEEEKTEEVVAEEEKESEDWGSFSLEGRVLAESTCTAMQGGSGVGYAIRRECNKKGPNCAKICREAVDPARKDLKLVCHNSIHVSDAVGSLEPGKVGLSTFRYNSCLVRGCGPNYCCCRAQPKAGVRIRRSCLSIVKNGESKGSGTYWVNPKVCIDISTFLELETTRWLCYVYSCYYHPWAHPTPLVSHTPFLPPRRVVPIPPSRCIAI